jgi:hypothetical protein
MLGRAQKRINFMACGSDGLQNPCLELNAAPTCASQKTEPRPAIYGGRFDIISTFNKNTWPVTQPPAVTCTAGQYANCYSAGCFQQTSWSGTK